MSSNILTAAALKAAGDALLALAAVLSETPQTASLNLHDGGGAVAAPEAVPAPVVVEPAPEPVNAPGPTLVEVRAVLAEKSGAGKGSEVREIIQKLGVSKLTEVDPMHYAGLLAEASAL